MTDVQVLDLGATMPERETDWGALRAVPQQVLKVKKLVKDATIPTYATDGSACVDLYAAGLSGTAYLDPKEMETFTTNLAVEVPPGHTLLVFPRSGLGSQGVRLANCVGVIDSDYRGPVKVALYNDGRSPMQIKSGDRIAQAMLVPIPHMEIEEVEELSSTVRGEGGFGSTGK